MDSKARLVGSLFTVGSLVGAIAVLAVGFHEFRAWNRCKVAWQHAGERSGDRLTDRAATPYLGMMLASKHEVPPSYTVDRSDFISACRAGAIREVVTRDEAGVYVRAVPIGAVRQVVPVAAN